MDKEKNHLAAAAVVALIIAVEPGKFSNMMAAVNYVDNETLEDLHAMCVNKVCGINGTIHELVDKEILVANGANRNRVYSLKLINNENRVSRISIREASSKWLIILNTNKIQEKICAEIHYIQDSRLDFFQILNGV